MVGYGYKSPEIVFYDSNNTSEPTEWLQNALINDGQSPEPIKQTVYEEAQLLADRVPKPCGHTCRDKAKCKHITCCKAVRPAKTGGNLTQVQYLNKIFKPHIEEAWKETTRRHQPFTLLEDNDGSHGTRTTTNIVAKYKRLLGRKSNFNWYCNVAQSPDLNIIENVWRIIKQRVKGHRCTTIEGLKRAIQIEWQRLDQNTINKLVLTMPARLTQVYRRYGRNSEW